MTNKFLILRAGLILLIVGSGAAGCSSDTPQGDTGVPPAVDHYSITVDLAPPPPDKPPDRSYGTPCTEDKGCDSNLCVEGFCSKICKAQSECPAAKGQSFDCGEVITLKKIACYPRRYKTDSLTFDHDCSLDEKCDKDYVCLGQPGAGNRYCSRACETDQDCPPTFRCATTRTGNKDPEKLCRRRDFCHPCLLDDQCGKGNLCLADDRSNKTCGKVCDPSGTSCPPYATCMDAGSGKFQCKHKKGYCYASFTEEGPVCDPCITHGRMVTSMQQYTVAEEGVCKKDERCIVIDPITMEAGCLAPCDGNNKCPSLQGLDLRCYALSEGDYCLPVVKDPEIGENVPGSCIPK